ncbi:FecR domain-containing protein [Chitinophaga sp. MM2321]|uniref:FecR family protein n=1 Tax=Chitinophaga sp. MM2321 TaxID=3137178 RepID=UPI0032D593EB
MTEKLAGIISAADEQLLDELIEEDEQVRGIWMEMQEGSLPVQQKPWLEVTSFYEQHQPRRFPVQWAAAAAIMICIGVAGWMKFNKTVKPPKTQLAVAPYAMPEIQNKKNGIQLQLASGSKINLSKASQRIFVDADQLSNSQKTLTYAATNNLPAGINAITVPIGMDYKINLSDGTEVWINSATTLRFPFTFSKDKREIAVNGEAYFKIAEDASRPFIVYLPNSTVEVMGTTFNVNSYDSSKIKVSLVAGAVKMNASKQAVVLKPGQQGVFREKTGALHVKPFDEGQELSWLAGTYIFSNATLDEVSSVIPRWFGVPVVIDNSLLGKKNFSGRVNRRDPITDFLHALSATTSVEYYFSKDSTLHFK